MCTEHSVALDARAQTQACDTTLSIILIQVGMNGDTFPIKAPKECSKKSAAAFRGKFLTREDVLRIFFLFLEDLAERCRHSSYSDR